MAVSPKPGIRPTNASRPILQLRPGMRIRSSINQLSRSRLSSILMSRRESPGDTDALLISSSFSSYILFCARLFRVTTSSEFNLQVAVADRSKLKLVPSLNSSLITHHSSLITHYSSLITHYSSLIARYRIRVICCQKNLPTRANAPRAFGSFC